MNGIKELSRVNNLPGGKAGSWNLLAEIDGNNNLVRSYMWGLDMSGTLRQAGGVGGLLGVDDAGQGFHFVTYDGNGNVMALVEMQSTDKWIMFKYDWMGRRIRKRVYNNTDDTWWLNYTRKYVYDLPGGRFMESSGGIRRQ